MKREIIGYKLKESCKEYESAAAKICGYYSGILDRVSPTIDFYNDCEDYRNLKKASVLKLWFEPIYEEEEETPVVKEGDWLYILSPEGYGGHTGDIVRVTKVRKDDDLGKPDVWINHTPNSFSGGGFRCSKTTFPYGKAFRLATKAEIEAYLSSEAIKRYPSGTTVNQLNAYGGLGKTYKTEGIQVVCSPTGSKYDHINVSIGGVGVYTTEHNIWAEIVPSIPQIKINGYDAKFDENEVSFGCQVLNLEMVRKLVELSSYKIHLVDADGKDITPQVIEIYNYLSELKD